MRNAVLTGLVLGLTACGSGSTSRQSEQSNGSCIFPPHLLTGGQGSGDRCSSWKDCASTCCSCTIGTSGNQYSAAECDGAAGCASISGACADTQTSSLCP